MLLADLSTSPSWNLLDDIREIWSFPFMVNAFRAGTITAVLSGVIGWFMVLRKQSFAGHTLAVVGFPGAAGATLLGVSASAGYFAFCVAAALVIASMPITRSRNASAQSALIGIVQAFALACGFLFTSLYKGLLDSVNSLLFGTFLGITDSQVLVLLVIGIASLGTLAIIGRPLLFASVDPELAAATGVSSRMLSTFFLVLLGLAVGAASQITGALLVFALLVMPAATAQALTVRPAVSLTLSVLIGLAATWLGLGAAFYSPYPIGFLVTTIAFATYVLVHAGRYGLSRLRTTGRPA